MTRFAPFALVLSLALLTACKGRDDAPHADSGDGVAVSRALWGQKLTLNASGHPQAEISAAGDFTIGDVGASRLGVRSVLQQPLDDFRVPIPPRGVERRGPVPHSEAAPSGHQAGENRQPAHGGRFVQRRPSPWHIDRAVGIRAAVEQQLHDCRVASVV